MAQPDGRPTSILTILCMQQTHGAVAALLSLCSRGGYILLVK